MKSGLWTLLVLTPAVGPLRADSINLSLDSVFNPSVAGTSPYVVAHLASSTQGTVTLTVTSPGLTSDPAENVAALYLNTNPALGDPKNHLAIVGVGADSSTLKGFSVGEDANKADGDGYYDVMLTFANGSVNHSTTNVFTITGSGPGFSSLTAGNFAFIGTRGSGSNTGPFFAAAHVQNTSASGTSGWVAATLPTPLALPGSMALFAVLAVVRRRDRRQLLTPSQPLP